MFVEFIKRFESLLSDPQLDQVVFELSQNHHMFYDDMFSLARFNPVVYDEQ